MIDVLDLIRPRVAPIPIADSYVEVESLRFLEWYRFDVLCFRILKAFLDGDISRSVELIGEALQLAAGLSASIIDADQALAVFVILEELNALRYIDPDFVAASEESADEIEEQPIENSVLVELITTLALRFSMDEIESMTPEFAILCWQRIREEICVDRDVIYYSSELGYNRKWTSKKEGKYTLMPRRSPYAPTWQRRRMRRLKDVGETGVYTPHFVVGDIGNIRDAKTGKTLRELGEVDDGEEQV